MGYMEDHKDWYSSVTNGDSERTVALRSGITTSTLNRQLSRGHLSEDVVIKVSRAYGVWPPGGLAATGYLTAEEATGVDSSVAADLLSDRDLIRQLARRINSDPAAWFGTFGELADDASVHDLHRTPDVEGVPYAADSSPIEPEPGDDDYHDGP